MGVKKQNPSMKFFEEAKRLVRGISFSFFWNC